MIILLVLLRCCCQSSSSSSSSEENFVSRTFSQKTKKGDFSPFFHHHTKIRAKNKQRVV